MDKTKDIGKRLPPIMATAQVLCVLVDELVVAGVLGEDTSVAVALSNTLRDRYRRVLKDGVDEGETPFFSFGDE